MSDNAQGAAGARSNSGGKISELNGLGGRWVEAAGTAIGRLRDVIAPITRADAPGECADNIFIYSKMRLLQAILRGLAGEFRRTKCVCESGLCPIMRRRQLRLEACPHISSACGSANVGHRPGPTTPLKPTAGLNGPPAPTQAQLRRLNGAPCFTCSEFP